MRFLRALKYLLSGGKRRWFARKARLLPAALTREGGAPGGALLEALDVGLEVDPDRALGLCQACDGQMAEACAAPAREADRRDLLLRAARVASGPAWRIGWTVARHLKDPEHLRTFGRGLAKHWAETGDADTLVLHLDECRGLELLDQAFLGDVMRAFLARKSLRDNPSWRPFFEHVPEALLPPVFEVHAVAGRARDAAGLARSKAQKEQAVELCLEDGDVDVLQQALALAEGLPGGDLPRRVHEALGKALGEKGDWSEALPHYEAAGDLLGQSLCHEHLGDLQKALHLCPAAEEERRLRLSEQLERLALESAGRGELTAAMTILSGLVEVFSRETNPSPAWLSRRGTLERHRAELAKTGRQRMAEELGSAPSSRRRELLLAASAFEEAASEWAEAALLLEQAGEIGDRLRASQLWEKDDQYGEAVRTLGPLADRADVQLRLAQLRETGGDAAGAAALFEHLRRWSDARHAFEAAGQWAEAARCFREEHGEDRALREVEYARLLGQAGHVDELLERYLERLDREPEDRVLLQRLRALVADEEGRIRSPRLRAAAAERLKKVVRTDLRQRFEQAVAAWIKRARKEVEKRYGHVWGMDLGTSKSAVALFDLERGAAVICEQKGLFHFPSTLAIDKSGNEIVGLDALEQLRPDLRGCVVGAKRAMGTRKAYRIGDRHFSPEEVAARILTHGRGLAEGFLREKLRDRVLELCRKELGEDCPPEWLDDEARASKLAFSLPEAVITIPAYFNFDQRRATRDAAEIAGIKLHRLIPEPTAACLSIGLTRKLAGQMMVVDLGAGTLDISYLQASYHDKGEGLFEVEKIFGDSQFGSSDFDVSIEEELRAGVARAGLGELGGLDRRRLHAAAEQLKISLSSSQTARYELVAFAGKPRHTLELTAARLEEILSPHLRKLEDVCRSARGLPIDHLVLVGGPMFSPPVRKRIEEVFGRKADAVVDPRTAVAMGAACQGAILGNPEKVPFLLLDIVPFALGILVNDREAQKPKVSFHIPRGTRIPHENKKPYTTREDNQPSVTVHVFQGLGESTEPEANNPVAHFHLEGLPPVKAGEPKIDVTFHVDENGLLEVTARDEKTGRSASLRIEDAIWLNPVERADMTARLTRSQRWGRERAELATEVREARDLCDKLADLARRGDAPAWQRRFAAWQKAQGSASFEHVDPGDQALLAEMYTSGQASGDKLTLGLDRARNLAPRCEVLAGAAAGLSLFAPEAEVEKQLSDLLAQGAQLLGELRETLATLEPLAARFQRYSATLAHLGTLHADPRDRLIACHGAGDYQRAVEAFAQAFDTAPATLAPLPLVHRHLDSLAHLGRRAAYRRALGDQRERLSLQDLSFDRLNEFGRHVQPGIAWVLARGLWTGSGFLAAPGLVVTNRHVVSEGAEPLPTDRLVVHVGGAPRSVTKIRFAPHAAVDLAVLELGGEPAGQPVRVGYTGLVEVGERVVAIGFPLPEGDSFEENLLIDHGIVNRIRTRPDGHGRELELGIRIGSGMSGGPVFNDLGEVIGVSTFVRVKASGDKDTPIVDKSSHAIAVETLHALLPPRW